jgi:hypothetical protein
MYIPDCQDITARTLIFSRNADTGMFDTRDAAQNILRAVAEAHRERLRDLPQQVPGGSGTLLDLCALPDGATDVRPPPRAVAVLKRPCASPAGRLGNSTP